jgi:hypothetical protein
MKLKPFVDLRQPLSNELRNSTTFFKRRGEITRTSKDTRRGDDKESLLRYLRGRLLHFRLLSDEWASLPPYSFASPCSQITTSLFLIQAFSLLILNKRRYNAIKLFVLSNFHLISS